MNARNIPGVGAKAQPARKADNLTEPIFWKMWDTQRVTTLQASTTSYRDNFIFNFVIIIIPQSVVFLSMRDRVSCSYKTTDKIIVRNSLICISLDGKRSLAEL